MVVRSSRNTYLSNVKGDIIIDFQFSLASIKDSESVKVKAENTTGAAKTDLTWLSGAPSKFVFELFIDRTEGSKSSGAVLDTQRKPKMYNFIPKFLEASSIANAILKPFGSKEFTDNFDKSGYNLSPNFRQTSDSVLYDLERIKYFMLPEGTSQTSGSLIINGDAVGGSFSVAPSDIINFNAAPVIRFFHGDLWREGFLTDFKYELSAMDRDLLPQRLKATLTIAVDNGGTFVTSSYIANDASLFPNTKIA